MSGYLADLCAMRAGIERDIARLQASLAGIEVAIAALDGSPSGAPATKRLPPPEPVEQATAAAKASGATGPAPDAGGKPKPSRGWAAVRADGLKRGHWSAEEVAELRRLARGGYTQRAAAAKLQRPVAAVNCKATCSGIHFGNRGLAGRRPKTTPAPLPDRAKSTAPVPRPVRRPGPLDPAWSVFDDLELVEGLGAGKSGKQIAADIERSPDDCAARFRAMMGLTPGETARIEKQQRLLAALREAAAEEEKTMGIAAE